MNENERKVFKICWNVRSAASDTAYKQWIETGFIWGYQARVNEISKLQQQLAEAEKEIDSAYKYLKATYDLHTWKNEPEYAMMKSFEEYQRKYKVKNLSPAEDCK